MYVPLHINLSSSYIKIHHDIVFPLHISHFPYTYSNGGGDGDDDDNDDNDDNTNDEDDYDEESDDHYDFIWLWWSLWGLHKTIWNN